MVGGGEVGAGSEAAPGADLPREDPLPLGVGPASPATHEHSLVLQDDPPLPPGRVGRALPATPGSPSLLQEVVAGPRWEEEASSSPHQ